MLRVLGVIPARYASTRFPGKPLAPLGHGTMLSAVWAATRAAKRIERVVVATEDRRIADACRNLGAEALMTSPAHASGTDRVAEVVERIGPDFDLVVNIQGDEPLVTATALDRLVGAFDDRPELGMATLAEPLPSADALFDPGTVKVVCAADGRALYFSRAPIPYHRGSSTVLEADFRSVLASRPGGIAGYWKHQGLYAYRRDVLLALTGMAPSPLEIDEGLEQLRALQAGITIRVLESDFRSIAVDTPDDLARAAAHLMSTTRQEMTR
ncbi:MAG TPA: 3-deoxy-manno-octulosonate cytidylyltransferase [Candidatus Polarisedimenticolaceae bacterium]|nr:3-deoxy-manno-octulosonate cytidylyltransferase [Candidatus Polarisedimenticolaceae bacterium]